jgi:cytochrome b6-f complex iron-sulfur subunit
MATVPAQVTSPRQDIDIDGVTRRSALKWMTLGWTGFAVATVAGLTASARFMFPNVLFEPPTRFKAGDPSSYSLGVDERWKEKFGIWIVRNTNSIYALVATCTHLGCTPNWLPGTEQVQMPLPWVGLLRLGHQFRRSDSPTARARRNHDFSR